MEGRGAREGKGREGREMEGVGASWRDVVMRGGGDILGGGGLACFMPFSAMTPNTSWSA